MRDVDGFVLTVPKKNLVAYKKMAAKAGKISMEHGALQYVEAAADDLAVEMGLLFPKMVKPKPGETIFFSWIVYKPKASRKSVLAKVMKNKPLAPPPDSERPFDVKHMVYGGFKALVDLRPCNRSVAPGLRPALRRRSERPKHRVVRRGRSP